MNQRTLDYMHTGPCAWARRMFREGGFVVLDTETTGLEDDAKIVSIGVVDEAGRVVLDRLINPGVPIPPDAQAIHGVSDDMVRDASSFADVFPELRAVLRGQRWLIYNRDYDMARLRYECVRAARLLPVEAPGAKCIMEQFAQHYGDWSRYHGSWKWQRLSRAAEYFDVQIGAAHNAAADALTAWHVLRGMSLSDDVKR